MAIFDQLTGLFDAAILNSRRLRGAPDDRIDAMAARERLERLAALRTVYDREEMLAYPDGFLKPGPPVRPERLRRATAQGEAEMLSWPSAYVPWSEGIGERYATPGPNDTARALRYLARDRPGPVVVAIHGYGAGRSALEPLIWPVRRWRRAGIDVVFPILPFHGERAVRSPPIFPSPDPRFSQEGFRQTVHDITSLLAWLRAEGHGPIALAGMSLGGYTAALLATLLDDIASALLVIPMSSIADIALQHGRLGEGPERDALHAALEAVYRPVMPFSRRSRLSPERVRVVATRGDRITGLRQAERLTEHFAAQLQVVSGSHVVQSRLPWAEATEALRRDLGC